MKNAIRFIKKIISNFLQFFKKPSFIIPELLVTVLLLSFSAIISTIQDNNFSSEVAEVITEEANKSKFKYSLNSIQMIQQGNSDYFIYSDNDLQNFQMRNQQETKEKSYIFAAYTPYGNYSSFSFKEVETNKLVRCTTILYESKYNGTSYYFDLPLLAGSFTRNTTKETLIITDTVAKKMIKEPSTYLDLIGQSISGYVEASYASVEQTYKIGAIVDTNNNLGAFLLSAFGENIVFSCEYNSFRMDGKVYFCPSAYNKDENRMIAKFVLNKYIETNSNARDLQIGYKPDYNFLTYDEGANDYIPSLKSESLKTYITFYSNKQNTILSIICIIAELILLTIKIYIFIKNKEFITGCGLGNAIFGFWFLTTIGILINSLLFKWNIFALITIHVIPTTHAHTVSTTLFLSWIFLALINTVFAALIKNSVTKKNINQ